MDMRMPVRRHNGYILFTLAITILGTACSLAGLWHPELYKGETPDWQAQIKGQDLSNLLFVFPLLLISGFLAWTGSAIGKKIWFGSVLTNLYAFVIYSFSVHFNALFHVYCAVLGLSVYAALYAIGKDGGMAKQREGGSRGRSRKGIAAYLFFTAGLFLLLWLKDSLSAVLSGTVPKAVETGGLATNPVQVLDFSFFLPLMVIAALRLYQGRPGTGLLAPAMLVFTLLTSLNIVSLLAIEEYRGLAETVPMLVFFGGLSLLTLFVLLRYFADPASRDIMGT